MYKGMVTKKCGVLRMWEMYGVAIRPGECWGAEKLGTDVVSCNSFHLLVLTIFFVKSLGFSMCKIMPPVNRDNFISTFLIWMPFLFLSNYSRQDFQYYVE